MKLSIIPSGTDHLRSLKLWFRELHDDPDGGLSLQHELLNAILTLRYSRERDGWCNWDESYHAHLATLGRWLPNATTAERISSDVAAVQAAGDGGADDGDFADAELERLTSEVFDWCCRRREVILLPGEYDFWSDVPTDAIP
jgi:hypothetical protein